MASFDEVLLVLLELLQLLAAAGAHRPDHSAHDSSVAAHDGHSVPLGFSDAHPELKLCL